jgi:hypothetical protein
VKKDQDGVRVEYLPLQDLKRATRNPKLHNDPAIRRSIDKFGFTNPLMLNEVTGQLVAGHGRLGVLEDMLLDGTEPPKRIRVSPDGTWLVPVIRGVSFDTEAEAEAYVVADNRLVETGGWDEEMLAAIFTERGKDQFEGYGWDETALESIMSAVLTSSEDEAATVASDGTTTLHPSVGESADKFATGTVRQVVLYFDTATFEPVLDRLAAVMKAHGLNNHTEVLLHLLKEHEDAAIDKAA